MLKKHKKYIHENDYGYVQIYLMLEKYGRQSRCGIQYSR